MLLKFIKINAKKRKLSKHRVDKFQKLISIMSLSISAILLFLSFHLFRNKQPSNSYNIYFATTA